MKKENNTETMDINTEPMSETYAYCMRESFDKFKKMIDSPNAKTMLIHNIEDVANELQSEDPESTPACDIINGFIWLCDTEFSGIPEVSDIKRLKALGNQLHVLAIHGMKTAIENLEEAKFTCDHVHNAFHEVNDASQLITEEMGNVDSLNKRCFSASVQAIQGYNLNQLKDSVNEIYNNAMPARIHYDIEKTLDAKLSNIAASLKNLRTTNLNNLW